jgi:hypothetical protein
MERQIQMVAALAAGAALVAMAFALGGCGGDDEADARARASCQAEARNAAQAAVLAKAYERGELGTRAQVQAHFTPDDRIFDEQGRMIPYSELEGLTKGRFDEWRGNSPFPGQVRDALAAASSEVRERNYPGC